MSSEIELRAHVHLADYDRVRNLILNSPDVSIQSRCFIDYSTFIEGIGERKLDVRFRLTNGTPEIIVKKGEFGGAVRQECSVKLYPDATEKALTLMSLLGYQKGVCGGRRIIRSIIGDVEFALQEVLDFANPGNTADSFLEVEYIEESSKKDVSEQISELRSELEKMGLRPFSAHEWNEYVAMLNKKWNGVYLHGETSPEVIKKLGS